MNKEQAKIVAAYKECLKSSAGKIMLDDLIKCFGKRCSFVKGFQDLTSFNEGQRSVVLRMEAMRDGPIELDEGE